MEEENEEDGGDEEEDEEDGGDEEEDDIKQWIEKNQWSGKEKS